MEKQANWHEYFTSLLNCKSKEQAVAALRQLHMPPSPILNAVEQAILGSVDSINQFLFSKNRVANEEVIWIAQTETDQFVWMIGNIDPIETVVGQIRSEIANYSALYNSGSIYKPPTARFINATTTSQWQRKTGMSLESESFSEDMTIFQVGYNGDDVREDVDQNFAINLDVLQNNSEFAYKVAKENLPAPFVNLINRKVAPNVRLFTAMHIELHNIGHFVGPWPFSTKHKGAMIYEAIEEFRACLSAASLYSQIATLDREMAAAFSLHILVTRIFYYGLRSFEKKKRNKAETREVIVACLFIDLFEKIDFTEDVENIIDEFTQALDQLHALEESKIQMGKLGLQAIAKEIYADTFLRAQFSPAMIRMLSSSH
jgi:hypothetical protein